MTGACASGRLARDAELRWTFAWPSATFRSADVPAVDLSASGCWDRARCARCRHIHSGSRLSGPRG